MTDTEKEVMKLVPGIEEGMFMHDCLELILKELKRLKEIEAKYEGLCK